MYALNAETGTAKIVSALFAELINPNCCEKAFLI
jgi:hypothetical protein